MSAAGAATFNSSVTAGGDVTAFSDMRIKHDIETIEGALAKVSDMRGVYFKRNNGEAGTGVIAQEIENILPEVCKRRRIQICCIRQHGRHINRSHKRIESRGREAKGV